MEKKVKGKGGQLGVRTRMAPSPTGELHIGGLRTLLFNYAFAKHNRGKFVLRIEDTDRERLIPGVLEKILTVIKQYGLSWDEGPEVRGPYGPYVQSQRLEFYQKYTQQLIKKGKAYWCFCSHERLAKMRQEQKEQGRVPKYDRKCLKLSRNEIERKVKADEPRVARLKIPDRQKVSFEDQVMGKVEVISDDLDDQVLLKSDGYPTYHLAVVVDDHLMKISHVIRGVEWISSTPKHVLLYDALGWSMPIYAHLPVFLDKEHRGKMSKRWGATSAQSFLDRGYLAEAVLNYLMLLGWAPADNQELFTLEEFVKKFTLDGINRANPAFDIKKLDWFNKEYLKRLSDEELGRRLGEYLWSRHSDLVLESKSKANETKSNWILKPVGNGKEAKTRLLIRIAPLVKERLTTLGEFEELAGFFFKRPSVPKAGWKADSLAHLKTADEVLKEVKGDDWKLEKLNTTLMGVVEKKGFKTGGFFMSLRLAICGKQVTPPLTESVIILGKEETVKRLNQAIKSNAVPERK
jgi:glutamyl-tRNA synthetase